jgi:hypothetical protein
LSKRSISAKAVVADIKKGLSDSELMSRHELSHGQLQKVLGQLIKAGYITQEELDRRRQQEVETSSAGPRGSNVTAAGREAHSSQSPRPLPPERHSVGPSPHLSPKPVSPKLGQPQPSSPSLPLSREEAARVRRNGLILISASYGFLTMGIVLARLREVAEVGAFPTDGVGVALGFFASLGWIVTATLGCLWRVRGLGQHAAWAIVAPLPCLNLVAVEVLSNRYEPQSDRRGLRVAFAVLGLLAWLIALSQIIKFLWGL